MKAYTLFYDDVMPELPGAPLDLVLYNIKKTCAELYSQSLCGREWLAAVDTVASQPTYLVNTTDGVNFEYGQLTAVKYNGEPLEAKSQILLDREDFKWREQTGTIYAYTMEDYNHVRLVKVPQSAEVGALVLQIARSPIATGGGIDDEIYRLWSDEIAAGVKGKLMRMARKPYSNAQLSREYLSTFRAAIGSAAAWAAKGAGTGPLRSRSYG